MNAITQAICDARVRGTPAIVAYLTAGYPAKAGFIHTLRAVARAADVVEIGVPFSDPMADGTTIQRSSREALAQGVSLRWLLDALESSGPIAGAPLLLMSYCNPLLAFGLQRLPSAARRAGIQGFIVPDLPLEESVELREALKAEGIALVQFVAPTTPQQRRARLAAESEGFLYAVTMNGITGQDASLGPETLNYLSEVRAMAKIPVCAGFGIRSAVQVARLTPHVDGVIVGSALVELLGRGGDPDAWIRSLRP
ncbi:MAG TPA: tryptophan synthase subunit alpha [Steroidobacteraceae bacterium]|nr:tryptophan synthase subunit alpha [Steroidobacteraceae bacterium]